MRGVKGLMRCLECGQRCNDRRGRSKVTLGATREVKGDVTHERGQRLHDLDEPILLPSPNPDPFCFFYAQKYHPDGGHTKAERKANM